MSLCTHSRTHLPQRLPPLRMAGQAVGLRQQQAAHHMCVVSGQGQVVQAAQQRGCHLRSNGEGGGGAWG